MKFKKVALIGCGLMGGSFALAAREAGWAEHIVGFSASAASRQKALSMGVIDTVAESAQFSDAEITDSTNQPARNCSGSYNGDNISPSKKHLMAAYPKSS